MPTVASPCVRQGPERQHQRVPDRQGQVRGAAKAADGPVKFQEAAPSAPAVPIKYAQCDRGYHGVQHRMHQNLGREQVKPTQTCTKRRRQTGVDGVYQDQKSLQQRRPNRQRVPGLLPVRLEFFKPGLVKGLVRRKVNVRVPIQRGKP